MYRSAYLPVYLSVCLSIKYIVIKINTKLACLSIYLYFHISIDPIIYPSINPFIYPFIYLFISPSGYRSAKYTYINMHVYTHEGQPDTWKITKFMLTLIRRGWIHNFFPLYVPFSLSFFPTIWKKRENDFRNVPYPFLVRVQRQVTWARLNYLWMANFLRMAVAKFFFNLATSTFYLDHYERSILMPFVDVYQRKASDRTNNQRLAIA